MKTILYLILVVHYNVPIYSTYDSINILTYIICTRILYGISSRNSCNVLSAVEGKRDAP